MMSETSMFEKTSSIGLRVRPTIVKKGIEKWYVITDETRNGISHHADERYIRILSMKMKRPLELFKTFSAAMRYLMPALSIADKVSERDAELCKFAEEMGIFRLASTHYLDSA